MPDPIPLDPARDVPLSTLGSTWIVAAGPSQPGAAAFKGDTLVMGSTSCYMNAEVDAWVFRGNDQ